jgi:aspartate aminotransferase
LAITAKANELKAQGVAIISFGSGQPDFKTPDHIQLAAIDAMRAGHTGYTAASGIPELKQAVCDSIKRDYGLEYANDNICASPAGASTDYTICSWPFWTKATRSSSPLPIG